MDIIGRLATIQQQIGHVENEKLQQEQMLSLFLEHPPALNSKVVGNMMKDILNSLLKQYFEIIYDCVFN
ncbi:hypothetical protein Hanom_Chr17g01535031 [Helianthus anomalus]